MGLFICKLKLENTEQAKVKLRKKKSVDRYIYLLTMKGRTLYFWTY